jgi:hypothetical protein
MEPTGRRSHCEVPRRRVELPTESLNMAGDWIKVEAPTPNKPEILRMARILGVSRDDAFGKAMRLWLWLDGITVDGLVDGVTSHDVDAILGTEGVADAFSQVGWLICDDSIPRITVPNFERHNGASAKARAGKARRQAQWRASRVDTDVDTRPSTNAPTREEKRREDNTRTSSNEDVCGDASRSSPASRSSVISFPTSAGKLWDLSERRLEEYRATHGDRIDVILELRKARQWLMDNKPKRKSPGGMPAFLTRWLNRASDYASSNGRPSTTSDEEFDSFLDRALKGDA